MTSFSATCEEIERLSQSLENRRRTEDPTASSGEFDRERKPIEPFAYFRHRRGVVRVQFKICPDVGGTLDDFGPGIEYARALVPNLTSQASLETFERGEVPITVRFDYQHGQLLETLRDHGVNAEIIIPSDGSVFAAQALMMNRYDVASQDFGKMFMEWVLTDEAQAVFAKYGARPIRSVVGDDPLVIPDDARVNWLPDTSYSNVVTVDFSTVDPSELLDIWENQVLGGS